MLLHDRQLPFYYQLVMSILSAPREYTNQCIGYSFLGFFIYALSQDIVPWPVRQCEHAWVDAMKMITIPISNTRSLFNNLRPGAHIHTIRDDFHVSLSVAFAVSPAFSCKRGKLVETMPHCLRLSSIPLLIAAWPSLFVLGRSTCIQALISAGDQQGPETLEYFPSHERGL